MKYKLIIASLLLIGSLLAVLSPNTVVMAQAKDGNGGITVIPTIPNSDTSTAETDGETDTSDTDVSIDETEKQSGGGSVIESNNTSGDGKTFYTVTTKDEQVFYIIVDNTKASDNVYLLTDVTQEDLAKLVNGEEPIIQETPEKEVEKPSVTEAETTENQPETAPNYMPIILLAVVLIGGIGGAYYYFKVCKPKRDLDDAEDLEDFSFVDEVESYRKEQNQSDDVYDLEDDDEEDDE
ncbi:CD1107 family mobile element protein [Listeria grandensis]|uniref:CD1107 family mobile element protein n=1 Tax=Listeria grandensis TaxID=1494963 RepID=UPI00164DE498|nr:DUF4366 domain-containing protein [Listeria grandensis]MBC6314057.1 DUF4366 domain-containing protein [Listeria grandensis]